MIVVDTMVISYFLIEGDYTKEVIQVRKHDPSWIAPILWKSEFVSVLGQYLRHNKLDLDLALHYLDLSNEMIETRSSDFLLPLVLTLSSSSGCSTYDCQYIAIAKQNGLRCITYDKQLLKAFPDIAQHPKDLLFKQ